jgi:hypothetical protein
MTTRPPPRSPRLFLSLCLALGFAAAGCPSTVNQDACRQYVDHLNGLGCTDDVDVEATCPQNLDSQGSTSCADFFACLTAQARCDGDIFINDVGACDSCAVED